MINFKDKKILITGATGGIGKALVKKFVSLNGNVLATGTKTEKLDELKKQFPSINVLKFDISEHSKIEEFIKNVSSQLVGLDVLVNNAIFPETQKERKIEFEKFPLELWNKIFAVNVTGVFLCNQKIGSIMVKQQKGSIINISSMYGIVAADQRIYGNSGLNSTAAYAVTKSSLFNFTRYLASYWRNTGVRINTLTLGGVENNQDPKFIRKYSEKTMIGRMAKKNEFTGALIFLASDASSYMTGSNMVVDGGWTAW